jgi:hypothetical protein
MTERKGTLTERDRVEACGSRIFDLFTIGEAMSIIIKSLTRRWEK